MPDSGRIIYGSLGINGDNLSIDIHVNVVRVELIETAIPFSIPYSGKLAISRCQRFYFF